MNYPHYRKNFIIGRVAGGDTLPDCLGAPTIMLQGQLICIEQLFDKQLFTRKNVHVYNHPYANNIKLYTVQTNKPVGTVWSYVTSGGNVWLQVFPGAPASPVWVKADNAAFSLDAIQTQGGQTYQDVEQANQSWWESITQGAQNYINDTVSPTQKLVKFGVPLVIGYIVWVELIKPRQSRNYRR